MRGIKRSPEGSSSRNHPELRALFLIPFLCLWSGVSLWGIYGQQMVQGKFELTKSLLGLPFVLGTLIFGSAVLMTVCGKVVVQVDDLAGNVFTGVGPVGWRRAFNPRGVTSVRVESNFSNRRGPLIVLEGPEPLRFGTGLSESRRDYMASVLRSELRK